MASLFTEEVAKKVYGPDFENLQNFQKEESEILNELQEILDEKDRLEELLQQISDLAGS
jgi:Cu/Ag efflux pump CusA